MAVNKAILIGNVGRDPEVKYIDQDTPVARFTLATTESYRGKNGERVETTEWHNIVLWRGLAKIAEQYVKKGSRLYIEGRITHRQYEKDGTTKYFTEIVANNMVMLDNRSSRDNSSDAPSPAADSSVAPTSGPVVEDPTPDDDLPF